jgi:hypothetical protein
MRILLLAVYIRYYQAYFGENEAEMFDVSDGELHHEHLGEGVLATEGMYSVGYPRWRFNPY